MAEPRPGGSGEQSPAQETSMQGRDIAHEAGSQVGDTARQVRETASASYAQGREQIGDVEPYLGDTIRTKPLQSLLLAAGVGLLIGLLWKKERAPVCRLR